MVAGRCQVAPTLGLMHNFRRFANGCFCSWERLFGASPGNGRRARDQVVTLQDALVDLLAAEVRSAFHGEKVWLHSRNVPVAEIVAWLEL